MAGWVLGPIRLPIPAVDRPVCYSGRREGHSAVLNDKVGRSSLRTSAYASPRGMDPNDGTGEGRMSEGVSAELAFANHGVESTNRGQGRNHAQQCGADCGQTVVGGAVPQRGHHRL